ncbi:MAG TPA: TIGR02996 domain-containing protein, partial [Urbifossiella sp.]|nr:TIGR02996 domain-containing protein [Urbifossiella sp.]
MTDEAALIAAARDRPDDQTPRLVYADWLDDHGQPERAAATRLLVPRPWRTREATEPERAERAALATALAARMDREEGRTGLAEYARRYVALCTGGQTTGSWHDGVDWVYNTLLVHWRRWLPPSVTTLARKAGRDAYNKDY